MKLKVWTSWICLLIRVATHNRNIQKGEQGIYKECAYLLQVHMCSLGSGLTVEESFELYCGDGEQVLQWLGYAACSRLAYIRGKEQTQQT